MYLASTVFVLPAEEHQVLSPLQVMGKNSSTCNRPCQFCRGNSNLRLLYVVHISLEPQPGGTVMVTPCSWYARDPEGISEHSAFNHWPSASICSKYPVLNEQIGEWEGKGSKWRLTAKISITLWQEHLAQHGQIGSLRLIQLLHACLYQCVCSRSDYIFKQRAVTRPALGMQTVMLETASPGF